MTVDRRTLLRLAGLAAAIPAMPRIASALDYPTGPVRIMHPFVTTDLVGRF